MTVAPQLSGLVKLTEVPDQETDSDQMVPPAVQALAHTCGCAVKRNGEAWIVTRNKRSYHVGSKIKNFDDWRATFKAVVEATQPAV